MSLFSVKLMQSVIVFFALLSFASLANRPEFEVELKNHLFYPAEIEIPANTKVKLVIYNRDTTPEEFDSFDLNREKVIFPQKKSVIFIGPLPPGRYKFFGEFNPNSAQGTIIVVPKKSVADTNIETLALVYTAPLAANSLLLKEVLHVN
ncbi:cupredoxin domain-containing protein [Colwellia sp. MB02u-18]|nr:cupredoxin domain-containing protein [Colwellia sp. MB3u-45]MBA6267234.1 cupredoxin domain-containing protein [Colwellia sp. MB3u-43]MBA6322846.1 cupredoxin domain-containing protein [Colwellia sp. MB02u-19]MBA6324746.1 cupredoxin domain-containing protein [Colwellia sp. MB02u-18]MBA6331063.1 cupredoxin domain-containing protein [Colwellia sp. MB02u-12]MBA6345315.1 cupredoxin domain-containing protein [Colwellia sp. MB02u-1]